MKVRPARRWVRLRDRGVQPAPTSWICFRARSLRAGRPEAIEVFLADPGLEDATTVDANVALSGEGPVTFVAVLFRRPDVDHSFFSRYWRETHIRFGYLIPKAKSYIQMHAVEGAPFDGVCEVAFDSVADLKAGLHAEIIAVDARADEEQFIDHRRSYGMVCVRERDSSASDFEASQS